MKCIYTTNSSNETEALAASLSSELQGKIVLLHGNLGAGKTTFVRGLARGIGLKGRVVSPTFAYEKIYGRGVNKMLHFDLYRASDHGDSLLEEELHSIFSTGTDTVLIEWPERLITHPSGVANREVITVCISNTGENSRSIVIQNEDCELLSTEDIARLYNEYHTPFHVIQHCKTVANFAVKLAKLMAKRGYSIDIQLLEQSALLHDLVRYVDFKKFDPYTWNYDVADGDREYWIHMRKMYEGKHHAKVGADILEKHGLPKTAQIVRKHDFLSIENGFSSWEEKLMYYADKRAKHDTIVSLHERLEDGKKRNVPDLLNAKCSSETDEKVFALEKEIFEATGTSL